MMSIGGGSRRVYIQSKRGRPSDRANARPRSGPPYMKQKREEETSVHPRKCPVVGLLESRVHADERELKKTHDKST